MNSEEKRRLANEKRLNAVRQWSKNRTVQNTSVGIHRKYDDEDVHSIEKKETLFESESEEEDGVDFAIRPQFEGQNGFEMLEMSSEFSSRFKLDERFQDDDEPVEEDSEKNDEKMKNIKILESVLGHQVNGITSAHKQFSNKKQIRFDPEDESSSKYLKATGASDVKTKSRAKKEKNINVAPEEIPVSSERYIEVSADLKDILCSSSGTFSLIDKFGSDQPFEDELEKSDVSSSFLSKSVEEQPPSVEEQPKHALKDFSKKNSFSHKSNFKTFEPRIKKEPFFVTEDDPRLKEGVAFFIRSKDKEEDIRKEWAERRDSTLEIFKRRVRPGHRIVSSTSHKTKKKRFS